MTETKLVYALEEARAAWLLHDGKTTQIMLHAMFCGYDEFDVFSLGDRKSEKIRGPMRVWGGIRGLAEPYQLPTKPEVCYIVAPDMIVSGVQLFDEGETLIGFVGVTMCGPTVIPNIPGVAAP